MNGRMMRPRRLAHQDEVRLRQKLCDAHHLSPEAGAGPSRAIAGVTALQSATKPSRPRCGGGAPSLQQHLQTGFDAVDQRQVRLRLQGPRIAGQARRRRR
jgi:hypothetical protein